MGRRGMMEMLEEEEKKEPGCYISLTKGFLLLLLCMVLCIGIGVIVHFAEKEICQEQKQVTGITTELISTTTAEPPLTTPEPSKNQSLLPVKYTLEFEPEYPSTAGSKYRGFLELEITCFYQTQTLVLDSYEITVDRSSVRIQHATDNESMAFNLETKTETLEFTLDEKKFEPGNNYLLLMNYTGIINHKSKGISASLNSNGTSNTIYTHFEQSMAKRAFPCFDEPSIKAIFQVTIVRNSNMTSVSNTQLKNQFNRGNGMIADVYEPTPLMSTYLLAFVISDYKYVHKTSENGTLVRVYYPKNFQREAIQVLDFSVKILDHFTKLFGVPYSLRKLDLFPIENFSNAGMENWGLILMSSRYMFFNPMKVSASMEVKCLNIIVHEIVHQWIGNLVTVDDWKHIWIAEGLTEYLSLREITKLHSSFKTGNNMLFETRLKALRSKQKSVSQPLSTPFYHNLAYEESAALFLMLDSILGEDNFNTAIKTFLKTYNQSNFDEDNLWDSMKGANISITKFVNPWVTQKNYPLLTVAKNNATSKLNISQEPFMISSLYIETFPSKGDTWTIPYTFKEYSKSKQEMSPFYYLKEKENLKSSVKSDWVLANVDSSGFYRVNYDVENWHGIIKQLKNNHTVISAVNRANLISDSWALTRAKRINPEIFLQLIDYMDKETSYAPWMAFTKIFDEFYQLSQESPEMSNYLNFFQKKIKKIYEKVGWQNNTENSFDERILQGAMITLACYVEYPNCISNAVQIYRRWKQDPDQNSINPDYRFIVLCVGLKEGSRRDCEFLNERLGTGDSFEDTDIRMALTCASQPWILKSHLENVVKSDLLSQKELTTIIAYIARNPVGTSIVKKFLESKCQLNDSIAVGSGDLSVSCGTVAESISNLVNYDILQLQNAHYLPPSYRQELLEMNYLKKNWLVNYMPLGAKWIQQDNNETITKSPRLPTDLKPIHYTIELKPDIYLENTSDFTFEGKVSILINCLNATKDIVLNSKLLKITNVTVFYLSTSISVLGTSHDKELERLTISISEEIQPGTNFTVYMDFEGPLTNDLNGLYYSTYMKGEKAVHLATTQFEPTSARKAFPCFDEPKLKATYDVILLRKNHFKSISNMPIKRSENRTDGYVADYFQKTPIMSTYLLAFIVCDFVREIGYVNNKTEVGVWTKQSSVPDNKLALNSTIVILEYYNKLFAYEYPLPKEDIIAIPDFAAGAMENWGLITYREINLLYNSNYPSISHERYVVLVVAHELAHQWFGNLVTMCWWNDLWLNEGFATFIQYVGMNHYEPNWKIFDYFNLDVVQRALKADGSLSSHPLDVPEGHSIAFDTISYQKGASVIQMLKFFLGDSIFEKGLQHYIKKHAYANAANKDLWKAFTEEAIAQNVTDLDVGDIMKEWILEMNYPVIFVKWTGSDIVIDQKRFVYEKTPSKCKKLKNVIWKVPFTYTTSKDLNFNVPSRDIKWLLTDKKTIKVNQVKADTDWIIGNVYQKGFYRVNYENDNWDKLIHILNTNHKKIPTANRAQIIDDAWNLAEAEMLDDKIPLDTLNYLKYERDNVPMTAAANQITHVRNMLHGTSNYGCFEEYMQDILQPSFTYAKNMNNTLFQSKVVFMACMFDLPDCIDLAKSLFEEWKVAIKDNKTSPLKNVELLYEVFCIGVRHGNKDDWFLVYTAFKNSNDASEKNQFIYALGCTQKLWLLQTYLKLAVEMKVFRRQDFRAVASTISRNPIGKDLIWQYVQKDWEKLLNDHEQTFVLRSLIQAATRYLNTDYQLNELENFMDTHPMLGVAKEAFESALDKTRVNIRWMKRNQKVIKEWLQKQNFDKKVCTFRGE